MATNAVPIKVARKREGSLGCRLLKVEELADNRMEDTSVFVLQLKEFDTTSSPVNEG